MKLKTFYEMAVKKGLREDPRIRSDIREEINKAKKRFRMAKGYEKKVFDKDSLVHPYGDTRILTGSGKEEIKNVMVGIDISVSELLLADRLRENGVEIHLVVSHHPAGRALANLHQVMGIQPDLWKKYGVDKTVGEGIMKGRMEQVARGVAPSNHARVVDAARLLGIPFMCIHTAADNCVTNYLQKLFEKKKPKKLKNVVAILGDIPEYRQGMRLGAGPYIMLGKETDPVGKILVDMTGGTSGPDKIFARLSQSGVKTLVGMHCKEENYKTAASEYINYVIAGHISSDNLGMNLLLDEIEKRERLNFIECSGFRRVRRK